MNQTNWRPVGGRISTLFTYLVQFPSRDYLNSPVKTEAAGKQGGCLLLLMG